MVNKDKKVITVDDLIKNLGNKLKLKVVSGSNGLNRRITAAEVNRPGVALTGWYKFFAQHRLQVLGKVELNYLKHLSSKRHISIMRRLMKMRIPAFIIARNYLPPPETVKLSNEYGVPIIRAPGITMTIVNKISTWLEDQFAPTIKVHGSLLEVNGEGILIIGKPGVGKSETTLALVERGHIFVADDVIKLKLTEGPSVTGYTSKELGHHMEIRGIGIINIQSLYGAKSVRMWKHIDFVVTLENWKQGQNYERLGLEHAIVEYLGVNLPNVTIPLKPGRDAALLIETAAQNEKLKSLGFNTAKAFNDRLLEMMQNN
jgi:HPr kinase/phosphorylase